MHTISMPSSVSELGFRSGASSVHTSRTMMFAELSQLLDRLLATALPADYAHAIIEENVLGKPTRSARLWTAKRLAELYCLDGACPLFRTLRSFWAGAGEGQPMLAFLLATARDPLLRETTPNVLAVRRDQVVGPDEVAGRVEEMYPGRFRTSTLRSTARNLASSWTQAGLLSGATRKRRSHPRVTPAVVAYALLLGYLGGSRGQRLFDTDWTRVLDRPLAEITDLAIEASRQGWLSYKSAGSVVEVTFPGLLTAAEERASREQD